LEENEFNYYLTFDNQAQVDRFKDIFSSLIPEDEGRRRVQNLMLETIIKQNIKGAEQWPQKCHIIKLMFKDNDRQYDDQRQVKVAFSMMKRELSTHTSTAAAGGSGFVPPSTTTHAIGVASTGVVGTRFHG
jgi:hypothetical protein